MILSDTMILSKTYLADIIETSNHPKVFQRTYAQAMHCSSIQEKTLKPTLVWYWCLFVCFGWIIG